jgi:raffinose synthase
LIISEDSACNFIYRRFASRLTGIKENSKFQKNGEKNEQAVGLKLVVDNAKQQHNVK